MGEREGSIKGCYGCVLVHCRINKIDRLWIGRVGG